MKRLIAVTLLVCLIITGCGRTMPEESDIPTEDTGSLLPSDEQGGIEPTEPPATATLMDSAEQIGTLGNLSYLPNTEIEEMTAQELLPFGDGLLLWSNIIGDNGCSVEFKLISLKNGALLGELCIPSSGYVTVQTCQERIGVCDAGRNTVYLLNSSLEITDTYTVEALGDHWYLSSDLKTLYQIDWQMGVYATDLTTGATADILVDATDIYVRNRTGNHVVLSYTDLYTQRTVCRMLNLQTGLLEGLPVDSDVVFAAFTDRVWLIGDSAQWGTYYVIADGQRKTALWQNNRFDLLLPQGQLLAVDGSGLALSLYDADGSFISRCEVPEDQASYTGTSLVWSDQWNGYFLLGIQPDQTGKLLFWDIQQTVSGEDFPLQEETEQGGVSAEGALYDRAASISEKFDINIRIADQCPMDYGQFSSYEVNDREAITQALDILEDACAQYPAGYFAQLKYGNIQRINFDLVGGLYATDESVYDGTYGGITLTEPDCVTVVLDIYTISRNNVYHEVTHMTDSRLAWDASLREDALFSEDAWNALLPEGFSYAQTYQDLTDSDIWAYVNSGYFVNDYACRYATEDRATMVEMAMMENDFVFAQNPHLRDKLAYYSECIRDCFHTDGWQDVTQWEKILNK